MSSKENEVAVEKIDNEKSATDGKCELKGTKRAAVEEKTEEVKKVRKEENGAGSEGEGIDEEEEEGVEGEEDDEEEEELPEGDDEELEGEDDDEEDVEGEEGIDDDEEDA